MSPGTKILAQMLNGLKAEALEPFSNMVLSVFEGTQSDRNLVRKLPPLTCLLMVDVRIFSTLWCPISIFVTSLHLYIEVCFYCESDSYLHELHDCFSSLMLFVIFITLLFRTDPSWPCCGVRPAVSAGAAPERAGPYSPQGETTGAALHGRCAAR